MRKKLTALLVGAALMLAAGSAWATPINSGRPAAIGSGDGPTLQQILTDNFNNSINATSGQSNVAAWTQTEADSSAYRVAFVAGHDGYLGIYSLSNPSMMVSLLARTGFPTSGVFTIDSFGTLTVNLGFGGTYANFGNAFGLYWTDTVEGYKAFTEDDKNGGAIRALTYQVADNTLLTGSLGAQFSGATSNGGNDWVVAFEDHPNGDNDYNDAVVYVEDMTPVPEPGTMVLLGAGLLGLAVYGKRRMNKEA